MLKKKKKKKKKNLMYLNPVTFGGFVESFPSTVNMINRLRLSLVREVMPIG